MHTHTHIKVVAMKDISEELKMFPDMNEPKLLLAGR